MMRPTAAAAIIALVAAMGMAATPTAFHLSLLNRGIADYTAGRDAAAVRELRIAAFGLIESVEHYETAQVYLALVSMRLGEESAARRAAEKVVAAEGVQRRYASLKLPQPVRTSFEALVGKLVGNESVAILRRAGTAPSSRSPQPTFTPAPPPPVVEPSQDPKAAAPEPQVVAPPPVETQPVPTPVQPPPRMPERAPEIVPIPTPSPSKPTTPAVKPAPTPVKPAPVPAKPAPIPASPTPAPAKPAPAKASTQQRLADGESALRRNALPEARAIYRELLEANGLDHPTLLLVAEGAYRARDFAGTVRAFERAGTLERGEEPYRYYLAVAMYETGDYRGAKRELAGALPYIEQTADVARYRTKIEGAIN